jgi:thymidylate synthase|tara:strand:- start:9 stop:878 length:870 start_codon:yes stop_codon:yes gene_type:complete
MVHPEKQYLRLVKNIIKHGIKEVGRNGTTYTQIGAMMRFPLENREMPILTTKKMAWKSCLQELLWFIKGDTNNKTLQNQNVKIWDGNASRKFLDSRNLFYLAENDLGPVYGHQWRFFNAPYYNCNTNYTGKGVDQLQNIIDVLKSDDKTSRRLILSAWNPNQIDEMALPPCHILSQFHVTNGDELSVSLYQRSGDVGLGIPFNIASYSFLTHIIATMCDLKPKEFIHHIGNAHIYDDHINPLEQQTLRTPLPFPILNIDKLSDINKYEMKHFTLENYNYLEPIKMKMRV